MLKENLVLNREEAIDLCSSGYNGCVPITIEKYSRKWTVATESVAGGVKRLREKGHNAIVVKGSMFEDGKISPSVLAYIFTNGSDV